MPLICCKVKKAVFQVGSNSSSNLEGEFLINEKQDFFIKNDLDYKKTPSLEEK